MQIIHPEHKWFGPLAPLLAEVEQVQAEIDAASRGDKAALKAKIVKPKKALDEARKLLIDAIKAHLKQLNKAIKELNKLQEERNAHEQEIKLAAEREIAHLNEAADDLRRILNEPDEARRYFAVVETSEITENEFNLNLPRYVDTFEPEKVLLLKDATTQLKSATEAADKAQSALKELLASIGGGD